jgi:hypothetical protein
MEKAEESQLKSRPSCLESQEGMRKELNRISDTILFM